jgi:hypothetical protein
MKHRSFKSNSFKKRATAALVSALKSIGSDGLNPVNVDVLCANIIADVIQNLDGVVAAIVLLTPVAARRTLELAVPFYTLVKLRTRF